MPCAPPVCSPQFRGAGHDRRREHRRGRQADVPGRGLARPVRLRGNARRRGGAGPADPAHPARADGRTRTRPVGCGDAGAGPQPAGRARHPRGQRGCRGRRGLRDQLLRSELAERVRVVGLPRRRRGLGRRVRARRQPQRDAGAPRARRYGGQRRPGRLHQRRAADGQQGAGQAALLDGGFAGLGQHGHRPAGGPLPAARRGARAVAGPSRSTRWPWATTRHGRSART